MSLKGKLTFVGQTDTGRVREHNEDTIASDGDSAAGARRWHGRLQRRRGRERHRRQDDHQPRARGAGARRPRIHRSRLGTRAPFHRLARRHHARQQDHLSDRAHAGRVRRHGHDRRRGPVYDNRISIAHVGDSRLYRLRGNQISQVTMDHSLLQELVDRGFYSPEEAQRAANKNYVTRALGVEPQVEVEVQEHPVDKGDIFILCSDGLSDMVEDEDIHLTISTFGANLDTVAKQLIQLANENGGRDNVSVVLAQANESFPASRGVMDKLLGWFS